MNTSNVTPKPYERIWEITPDPLAIKPRAEFRCLFCGGPTQVSHGVYFEFELKLHGDSTKKSHAMDTWLRCHFCGWTDVHGVAMPDEKYQLIADAVHTAQRVDEKGGYITPDPNEERPSKGMIFPMNQEAIMEKPTKPPWLAYDTEIGILPGFPMTCKKCGPWIRQQQEEGNHTDVKLHENGEVPMILRHSRMHQARRSRIVKRWRFFNWMQIEFHKPVSPTFAAPVFRVSYKCPVCDWLSTFVVPVPQEYFDITLELRGGEALYYPPLDDWGKDADYDLVKEKLESLGYV